MNIQSHKINNTEVAELITDQILIHHPEDALNLLGTIYYQGFDKLIIHEKNLTEDFFDLKNKMAGEILQKFSNYRVHLAIIGDFSKYKGTSITAFIYESNKGRQINFVSSVTEALYALTS